MTESFPEYFAKLERLSTDDLDRSTLDLVLREKQSTALVIAHLAEIARRKADLERGYPSLFEYCLRRLNLSEGSVALRIQVANVARRFPQVLAALAQGKISLSVAGRIAPHLRPESVESLLRDCAGMTKREVDEHLVRLEPKPVVATSIRRKATEVRQEIFSTPASPRPDMPRPDMPRASLEPAQPEVFNFRFAAGKSFREKLVRLGEVLGIAGPERNMAEVLERALDLALERKDPAARHERRLEREQKRAAEARAAPRPDEDALAPATSRHIPLALRDRVFARAGHQCEFAAPGGARCTSRTALEIEHAMPFAIHRSHEKKHLRAYCLRHNLLGAERTYGTEFIRAKIEARRTTLTLAITAPPPSPPSSAPPPRPS